MRRISESNLQSTNLRICANFVEFYSTGLGLYARRHFLHDEAITVYLGVWPPDNYVDKSRRLKLSHGKFIDADKSGKRPLHMGADFAYTPYIHCNTVEDKVKYEGNNWFGKNANRRIEGCVLICTSRD